MNHQLLISAPSSGLLACLLHLPSKIILNLFQPATSTTHTMLALCTLKIILSSCKQRPIIYSCEWICFFPEKIHNCRPNVVQFLLILKFASFTKNLTKISHLWKTEIQHISILTRTHIIHVPTNQPTEFLDHAKISAREASVIQIKRIWKANTPKPQHKFSNRYNN